MATDTASMAIADPATLAHRVNDDVDWWIWDYDENEEVINGQIALVDLSCDGCYEFRVTSDALYDIEKRYARKKITYGLKVESGQFFIGHAESLPGGGDQIEIQSGSEQGIMVECPNGQYTLTLYAIDTDLAKDDGVIKNLSEMASIVVVIEKKPFNKSQLSSTQLFDETDTFLFSSEALRDVLRLNIKGHVSVSITKSGLTLQPDLGWPNAYMSVDKLLLDDMTQVRYGDYCLVESCRLDKDTNTVYCQLIETLYNAQDRKEREEFSAIERFLKKAKKALVEFLRDITGW